MTYPTAPTMRTQLNGFDAPGTAADRRRYRRVSLELAGRFMRADKQEYPCNLNDISVGGASIASDVPVEIDERIVLSISDIGSLEGNVVRTFPGGFALRLSATQRKREKLAAQLTWLINRHEFSGIEDREHERISAGNRSVMLVFPDGSSEPCSLIDISLSGANVATSRRPPVGSEITVGKQRAIVRRHHDDGIGVQFRDATGSGFVL